MTGTIHDRNIVTNNGWKIILDRGLDIFQHYEMNDTFAFANKKKLGRNAPLPFPVLTRGR